MAWQVTEVQKALKGADYPMSGEQLAELAERNGGDGDLVEALRGIDREVDGPNGVMKELKGELGGKTQGSNKSDQPDYKEVEGPNFQVDEVQKYLKGADYPMDGEQLAALAERNGAQDDLIDALKGVGRCDGPSAVQKQLKDHLGGRPSRSGD